MANTTMTEVATAAAVVNKLADLLGGEANLRQAMMLFAVAQAGHAGTDSATLEKKLGMSPAAVSRTIRVLSDVSYDKNEGKGLIDLALDPVDNRRRVITVNSRGTKAITKIVSALR